MQDVISQVLSLLRGAWRFRWVAVGVAWLVAVAGWIGVQFIPDKYTSSTQVYVDTESLLAPLLAGLAVDRDVMSQVGMMQAVMLSRPNLEKVAQTTDLMLGAKTRKEQEAVIDSLAQRIQLGRPNGPAMRNTFQVSFDDNDPKVAHRVVRTLLDTFMEDSLGLKRSDTRSRSASSSRRSRTTSRSWSRRRIASPASSRRTSVACRVRTAATMRASSRR